MKVKDKDKFLSAVQIGRNKNLASAGINLESHFPRFSKEEREELIRALSGLERKFIRVHTADFRKSRYFRKAKLLAEKLFPKSVNTFLIEAEEACCLFDWWKGCPRADQKDLLLDIIKSFQEALNYLEKIKGRKIDPIVPRATGNALKSPFEQEIFKKFILVSRITIIADEIIPRLKCLIKSFQKELAEVNLPRRGAPPDPVAQFILMLAAAYDRAFLISPSAYQPEEWAEHSRGGGIFYNFLKTLFPMLGLHFQDSSRSIQKALSSLKKS